MNRPSRLSLTRVGLAIAAMGIPFVFTASPASAGISYVGSLDTRGNATLYHPRGVTADGVGNVYVADTQNHRIVKFDPDGRFLGAFGRGSAETASTPGHLYYPESLTYANDHIYVADTSGNDVQVFTDDGEFVLKFGTPGSGDGQLNNPTGITSDCQGDIYVSDSRNNSVEVFTPNGGFIRRFGLGDLAVPVGVADATYTSEGCNSPYIFVADEYAGKIAQYDFQGGQLLRWIGTPGRGPMQFDHPDQIAFDISAPGKLDLWVAESGSFRVQQIRSTDGGQTWAYVDEITQGEMPLNAPHGVAVDRQGRIIVANTGENAVDFYKLKAPKLTVNPNSVPRHYIKDTEGLHGFINYNQLGKGCAALVSVTVTVPPHASHVFTENKRVTFTDRSDWKIDLSHRQVRWLSDAWDDGRKVPVDGKAKANCDGGVHVVDTVHWFV